MDFPQLEVLAEHEFKSFSDKVNWCRNPNRDNFTWDDVKALFSHVPTTIRSHNGRDYVYFQLKTPTSSPILLIREALMIAYPEFRHEDLEVADFMYKTFAKQVIYKLEEFEDGTCWYRSDCPTNL